MYLKLFSFPIFDQFFPLIIINSLVHKFKLLFRRQVLYVIRVFQSGLPTASFPTAGLHSPFFYLNMNIKFFQYTCVA